MKRKICILLFVILSVCTVVACNNTSENLTENIDTDLILQEVSEISENVETEEDQTEENYEIKEDISEENTETDTNTENNEELEDCIESEKENETEENIEVEANYEIINNLTFEVLSQYSYYFSSGAGGWGEEFNIERDGYFKGKYYDSDMGSNADAYPYGTFYSSNYSGYFDNLKKIDEYSYEMTMREIHYKDVPGTEEIKDGTRYIYTDAYCLGGTDTFKVYLPGTPLDILSEDILIWIGSYNKSETELTQLIIVDEENDYGICSFERLSALDDATMHYNTYKESYDYYTELAAETTSTAEMVDNAKRRYELADDCLNYLWDIIRYNVDEEEFDEILNEQREWIAEKEAQAQADFDEWGGGSGAPVSYYDTLADMTMERCGELLEYIE